ncbi:MAG: serine/threonine-protein phosphatase [Gammaproteobacteria bacterium]|nr:serine/threonine-protein phosphatase [Gammaproteobacteria bacterium]
MSNPNPSSGTSLSWSSHAITNVGKVRKHNEDSVLARPEIGLWVVADGMGGHAKGDVASQMIVESMKKIHEGTTLAKFIDDIEDRIDEVNKKLVDIARESKKRVTIGSTVVMMHTYDKYCIYLWAGDSRLYRLRDNKLSQVTTDHSQVEQYIEQGLISRSEAEVHPHGNMITRAVGATEDFYLDMDVQEMQKNDRYMLCSDGLTKHINDSEIEAFMRNGSTEECCKYFIDVTLERGAGDNVTCIVIDIE